MSDLREITHEADLDDAGTPLVTREEAESEAEWQARLREEYPTLAERLGDHFDREGEEN